DRHGGTGDPSAAAPLHAGPHLRRPEPGSPEEGRARHREGRTSGCGEHPRGVPVPSEMPGGLRGLRLDAEEVAEELQVLQAAGRLPDVGMITAQGARAIEILPTPGKSPGDARTALEAVLAEERNARLALKAIQGERVRDDRIILMLQAGST